MSFCTSCGRALEVGARFCTSCGNPVQSTSVSSANPPVVVAPAPTPELVSVPPLADVPFSTERNRPSMPLIVVGIVLVILIGLAVGSTLYMRKEPASNAAPKSVDNASNSPDADDYLRNLNLASYPGSTPAAITTDSTENVITAFQTRDTPQQVIGYYKVRFPVADTIGDAEKSELRAALPNGAHVVIRAMQQASGSLVYIIRQP